MNGTPIRVGIICFTETDARRAYPPEARHPATMLFPIPLSRPERIRGRLLDVLLVTPEAVTRGGDRLIHALEEAAPCLHTAATR